MIIRRYTKIENPISKLFNKYWLKYTSIIILIALELIAVAPFIPTDKNKNKLGLILVSCACILILFIYIFNVIKENKLPRAKKNELAILFYINCDNRKQYNDIKRTMVDKFDEAINNKYNFKVLYIPYIKSQKLRITKAKIYIAKCQNINENNIWRYSMGFLLAYENKNLLGAYKHYNKGCKSDYNILDIISFTENILEDEPERNGLRFALGILYSKSGDKKLMEENFNKFLKNVDIDKLDTKIISIIEMRIGKILKPFNQNKQVS